MHALLSRIALGSSLSSQSPRKLPFAIFGAALALLLLAVPPAPAQSFDATALREPMDLGMAWRVQPGDNPAYAWPEFDDSKWALFDPHTTIVTLFPPPRPEIVWYRLRVKVNPASTGLALREQAISRAFEVYVNSERLLAVGSVTPFKAYTVGARRLVPIPDRMVATGTLVIALHVHISPVEWESGQFPGFYPTNLTLGQQDVLDREDWLAVIGANALAWLSRLLLVGVGIVSLALFTAQRRQPEYLWVFALATVRFLETPVDLAMLFHDIPVGWQIASGSLLILSPLIYVSMYFTFVSQRIGWRFRALLLAAGLLNGFINLQGLFFSWPAAVQLLLNLPFITILTIVIPVVLALKFRRGNREAGILLIPAVFLSLYIYAKVVLIAMFQFPALSKAALTGLNLIDSFPAGPFAISLDTVSGILSTISLAIIMVLRSTRMSRQQALLESELAAAREIQQVMVPEHTETVAGFTVDTAYQPAQQVGGDYFQILPAGQGGMLVVVGDVAGKGLPAAMLVSVLVGAIRGVAEYTSSPAELLGNLNERLLGRAGGGFSTALVAHIQADGQVTIANAGHLSPYMDGAEVMLPGALPLGIKANPTYEICRFNLAPGSRLTFYSDGVVEAQNAQGELFGFERGREISTQPAAAIVAAATRFGQADDITVVTIERAAAIATAA